MAYFSEEKTCTIAQNGTVSTAVDLGAVCDRLQIEIPTLDSANLTFQVAMEDGVYQALGPGLLVVAAGTGGYTYTIDLGGFRWVKIITSAAQTTALRTFRVKGYRS